MRLAVAGFIVVGSFCPRFTAAFSVVISSPAASSSSRRSATKGSLGATKSSWGVADDWSSLSSDNPQNGVDSNDIFNQDLAWKAAQEMEPSTSTNGKDTLSAEDTFLEEVLDELQSPVHLDDPPLYDTNFDAYTRTETFVDQMGKEIAMLVRCNERPEEMLVQLGKAVPELTQEEKNDVSQLVVKRDGDYVATDFFRDAVSRMFREHAIGNEEETLVMDANCVANWMTKSLRETVGRHERRVLSTIAKYGAYKSGLLTLDDFQRLYLDAITQGQVGKKIQQEPVDDVWRDIRNHGMISPNEADRLKRLEEIEAEFGVAETADQDNLMDECEILEWDERFESPAAESGRQSSNSIVELADDGKTPLYIKDGEFVFIDEESCIGCMQCALVSPSSFLMLDSGRARTFEQRVAPDVSQAIASCPVGCMHKVSFRELKELEHARDNGDGRTDHRHLGHKRGHTPLSVAGIDSDANHKSSWYHYLKNKCYLSGDCPKKGCYNCPHFSKPGANPHFQNKLKESMHIRAQTFMENGSADKWRKKVDL